MANTVTTKYVSAGARDVIVYCNILSDGTTLVNQPVYVSATAASNASGGESGDSIDTKNSKIISAKVIVSSASTLRYYLTWDATSQAHALALLPATGQVDVDFEKFGGLPNPQNTGCTGNINIQGAPASGDSMTLVLKIRRT